MALGATAGLSACPAQRAEGAETTDDEEDVRLDSFRLFFFPFWPPAGTFVLFAEARTLSALRCPFFCDVPFILLVVLLFVATGLAPAVFARGTVDTVRPLPCTFLDPFSDAFALEE